MDNLREKLNSLKCESTPKEIRILREVRVDRIRFFRGANIIMTRVLLYSDEPILAKGLESVLRQIDGFELLPTSNTLASLMEQITQGAPDLVLMDLTAEITFAVLSDMKHAMNRSRIVLWVNSISTELAFQAMGLGVRGILRKT